MRTSSIDDIVQGLGKYFGKTPTVTSAIRAPKKNKGVGGADKSRHLLAYGGDARDIVIPGVSQKEIGKVARLLGAGGVGYYKDGHVHIDKGKVRTWNG